MAQSHKRSDLQALAVAKAADAQLLLANRRNANAFYLSGYAIELGLKACIAKQIIAQAIPDRAFVNSIYNHSFGNLVGVAGLSLALKEEQAADPTFATYWGIAGQWNESSRYVATDIYTAQLMVQAVVDPASGLLKWIQQHW